MASDWQTTTQKIAQRGQYLLETGQWSDCKFIVGQEPHQQIIQGHKVFLAMSSPVFEAMFYGTMAEKNDPIPIKDVQPEAFKALMEYIYCDRINLESFELACELCYCAKKYMLPFLVEECTKFLWSDLSLKKACRAYEFAKLFEEPVLMEKCLQIICSKTEQVLKESSWEEVEQATVLTLLDQEDLQISSEIDLFNALERWAKAECIRKTLDPSDPKALKCVIGDALTKIRFLSLTPQEFAEGPGKSSLLSQQEAFAILMNISSHKSKIPMPESYSQNSSSRCKSRVFYNIDNNESLKNYSMQGIDMHNSFSMPVRRCYPGECSTSSMNPSFFQQDSIPGPSNIFRMPIENREFDGDNSQPSNDLIAINSRDKFYCVLSTVQQSYCRNYDVMDCSVTFKVDKNIYVLGVQVPSQISDVDNNNSPGSFPVNLRYTEVLYAHLLDSDGTRLSYTHYRTMASLRESIEISFNKPVSIQKNKVYKIGVTFNKAGWYPVGNSIQRVFCNDVQFSLNIGVSGVDYIRDGLIKSIVFTNAT